VEAASLRGAALVSVVQPTNLRQLDDVSHRGKLDSSWVGSVLVQREVSSRELVVVEVVGHEPVDMALTQDDDVIEKLTPDGANEALDVRILPR
jgi:hypothetical protein